VKGQETAVLCSGGLDSVTLLVHLAREAPVQPLYVSAGLAWEAVEQEILARLLTVLSGVHAVKPLQRLHVDMRDVYPVEHWAVAGRPPAYHTPDEDVYIVGRNVVLLSKAAVYCAEHGIPRVAMGTLAGNPFPDATPAFLEAFGRALSMGLDHPLTILTPFARLQKADVVRLAAALALPLNLTLSCMNPAGGLHCGRCSKCRERQQAFTKAGLPDPAPYAPAHPA
jgi:7-cyano-7-deazaguanine synthase